MFSLKTEAVEVRGEKILVRELTAGARTAVLEAAKVSPLTAQIIAAQMCAVDGTGALLCKTYEQAADWPPDVVEAIADKAMNLSGMEAQAKPPKA
jgi:hypothetical protein